MRSDLEGKQEEESGGVGGVGGVGFTGMKGNG